MYMCACVERGGEEGGQNLHSSLSLLFFRTQLSVCVCDVAWKSETHWERERKRRRRERRRRGREREDKFALFCFSFRFPKIVTVQTAKYTESD